MVYVIICAAFIATGAFLTCIFGANEDGSEEDEEQIEYLSTWYKRKEEKKKRHGNK